MHYVKQGLSCIMLLAGYTAIWIMLMAGYPAAAQDTTQHIIPNRVNAAAQIHKPYVILISADGFRYDLAEKYHATNLLRLSAQGVRAAYMQSSYPSLTFPNHYTIATGLYPAHSGLVDNTFYDPAKKATYRMGNRKVVGDSSWYGGTPLWTLAEQQHMLSASFYWVGSETAVQGVRPTYYYTYNDIIPIDTRIEAVKKWLQLPEDKRPHFITFYFPEVDHAEHGYGPDSKETEDAVHFVDESIGKMTAMTDALGLDVNYIFVSDHGMTTVDVQHTLDLSKAIDTSKFIISGGLTLIHLYAKDKKDIEPTYNALRDEGSHDYDVYLAADVPAKFHYSKSDDTYNRIGDIVLIPHEHKVFNPSHRNVPIGQHGYDPAMQDMHATFYAWGPMFVKNKTIDGFENVNIYPLVAYMLGLPYTFKTDGNLNVLKPILK